MADLRSYVIAAHAHRPLATLRAIDVTFILGGCWILRDIRGIAGLRISEADTSTGFQSWAMSP